MFWTRNQSNHQNFDPSLLAKKLWLIFMGMKQKKIQNGRLKKLSFSIPPILNILAYYVHNYNPFNDLLDVNYLMGLFFNHINICWIHLIIFCFVFNRDGWKWNLNILWMSWKRCTKANVQKSRTRNQSQMNYWVETTQNLTKTMSKVSG